MTSNPIVNIEPDNKEVQLNISLVGKDGRTPVKGKDYWNEEDKSEIINEAVQQINQEIGELGVNKTFVYTDLEQGYISDYGENDGGSDIHFESRLRTPDFISTDGFIDATVSEEYVLWLYNYTADKAFISADKGVSGGGHHQITPDIIPAGTAYVRFVVKLLSGSVITPQAPTGFISTSERVVPFGELITDLEDDVKTLFADVADLSETCQPITDSSLIPTPSSDDVGKIPTVECTGENEDGEPTYGYILTDLPSYKTDNTLSIEGTPADAAAVGTKFTQLTEEKVDKQQGADNAGKLLYVSDDGEISPVALGNRFKYTQELGKNIFPENWENGNFDADGEWVYSNTGTSNIAVNAKIPVTPGGTYTLSNTLVTPSAIVYLHKWGEAGNYLGKEQFSRFNSYTKKTVTLSDDVYYIGLSAYASGQPDYKTMIPDQVMIEAGNTATEYEPYGAQNTLGIREDTEIPDYWQRHISEKIKVIQTLHKTFGKDCFSFVAMSDMHYNANLGKKSPLLAKRIMDECAIKYAYELGDVSNQGALATKDAVITECESIEKMLAPIRDRLLVVQGNHDGAWGQLDQDGNGTIEDTEYYCYNLTPGEMHQWLFRKVGLVGDVHFDDSGTAYYVDDTANRVRYIALNCNCLDYALNNDGTAKYNTMRMYRFTQKQYDFLLDALVDGLDERWNIVVGAHVPLDGTEGSAWGTESEREYTLMKDFLTAFKNKTSFNGSFAGTSGFDAVTVTADFTIAKANFVGYFCGHMHNDYHLTAKTYGIDMIGIASDRSREGMTAGTTTEQSFDVVTVDTKNRKIYCTKIGFGEDREISY